MGFMFIKVTFLPVYINTSEDADLLDIEVVTRMMSSLCN